jgi:Fe-S cluster biogenesis protein NfuA
MTAPDAGERIEKFLADIERGADPETWRRVEGLVRELLDLYGEALAHVLAEADDALVTKLERDPLVAGLLSLHGLRSESIEARIERALDEVRPYLGSHAGGVHFAGLDGEGRVHLQLEGTCQSCPSSRVTLDSRIRVAIERVAPEVTGIEVAEIRSGGSP